MSPSNSEHDRLFLGRRYDLESGAVTDEPLLYDARHLTTHGVILGMTGSGKTGAGIVLLEEALLHGIPILALDPKGDIANLLLTFPQLRGEDLAPWVDAQGAQRRGVSVEQYAAEEASKWKEGLAAWGIDGDRIARLRDMAQFSLYTPGSSAGRPVDVLHFLDGPDLDWEEHEESMRERVGGLVSALLGLVGIDADPLQSPEHVLLARIVEHVWRAGGTLDLPELIRLLQKPPFQQVGVFELETFFPEKDRFTLARTLNNLIAAPGFEIWQEGASLDVDALLHTDDGRPCANIFYLAHLNDAQRLFFTTLFLESVRDWLRAQSGTSNLRALLYFDEVYGYFPPYPKNPATKAPLMALIKQGRAGGLGVVLATQNPADLDYKGLSNAGMWMLGALRTERDKARVLEGLEGAIAEAGAAGQRTLDDALGALKPRVFLLHDIHAGAPVFFHTRWAMSYLAGPLTRKQVRELAGDEEPASPVEPATEHPSEDEAAALAAESPAVEPALPGFAVSPPTLPPDVPQVFLPPTTTFEWALRAYEEQTGRSELVRERALAYVPHLLARGTVRMVNQKRGVDQQEPVARLLRPGEGSVSIDWEQGEATVEDDELLSKPMGEGLYAPVPSTLARARDLKRLGKDFSDHLYYNTSLTILHNPALDLYGEVGEGRRDFRIRCEKEVQRRLKADLKEARARVEKSIDTVERRLRREERELDRDEVELEARKQEQVLGGIEAAFNILTGKRTRTAASRFGRRRTMTQKAEADVDESLDAIEDMEGQLEDLEAEWEEQAAEINQRWADKLEEIEEFVVKPRRADVRIEFCGLAWVPAWQVTLEDGRRVKLPARGS